MSAQRRRDGAESGDPRVLVARDTWVLRAAEHALGLAHCPRGRARATFTLWTQTDLGLPQ
jgi:hypothetical protein